MSGSQQADRDERLNELEREVQRLRKQLEQARDEIDRLRQQLEEALRASKRQAAPHSRGELKDHPKTPGRKPGAAYGQHATRPVPPRVDEPIAVPLPERCPHCGEGVEFQEIASQYQEDIVRRTVVRRFDIAVGHCRGCGRHVQGRHPLQTSEAVGVGGVQLGPEALTLAAQMTKQMGLSLGNTQRILAEGFGLQVSRGGLYRAFARMASRCAPTYDGLIDTARQTLVNVMDETGWKVGGRLQWLHVAVNDQCTVYTIEAGRGFDQSAVLVGAEYTGFLVHDGWAPYYKFVDAMHQSCVGHLLRRAKDMAAIAAPAAAGFPRAVRDLLHRSLVLRDRYARGDVSAHGLSTATGRLDADLDRLLAKTYRNPANRRLANHLERERVWLFSFLHCPGLDATNNTAERAIRVFVIARKVWGGNRTWNGARTQAILASVLRTCRQQGKDAFARLVSLLRSPTVQPLDLVASDPSP